MEGPIYIVSDNHFSMDHDSLLEKQRRKKIFQVFKKIKSAYNNKGSLIIGGDFFDYWFEYKNVIPKGYENLIESLLDLTSSGLKVHFVVGNHDYWDFGYLNQKTGIIIHKDNLKFKYNNQNILLTHGDGLLKQDYGYRILKKVIRHPIFIKLFNLFPPQLTCELAKKISKSSSKYNHHDKFVDIIKKDVLDYAKKQWINGYDTVLVGHYHQTGIIEKKNHKLIFLGDWLSQFTVTMINEKKYWQGDWQQFLELS